MKNAVRDYGEVLEIDGTHRTNRYGMALYFLSIFDNNGKGRVVGFFLIQYDTIKMVSKLKVLTLF